MASPIRAWRAAAEVAEHQRGRHPGLKEHSAGWLGISSPSTNETAATGSTTPRGTEGPAAAAEQDQHDGTGDTRGHLEDEPAPDASGRSYLTAVETAALAPWRRRRSGGRRRTSRGTSSCHGSPRQGTTARAPAASY